MDQPAGENPTKRPIDAADPPPKRPATDGSLERVNPQILEASKDVAQWIAERRKRWPTAQRIKERQNDAVPISKQQLPLKTPNQRVCRYFLKGTCRLGDKCRFAHIAPGPTGPKIYKRFEAPVKGSLFVKLVQSDHDLEDQRVLDFILKLAKEGRLD